MHILGKSKLRNEHLYTVYGEAEPLIQLENKSVWIQPASYNYTSEVHST